jgi:hypothetical protein
VFVCLGMETWEEPEVSPSESVEAEWCGESWEDSVAKGTNHGINTHT